MPIPLGVLAVAGAGAGPVAGGPAYELISSEILTGTQASVTFSNLNSTYGSTYQHLQVRFVARSNRNANDSVLGIRFNGTDAGYFYHELYGTGSGSPVSGAATSQSSIRAGRLTGNNSGANSFGAGVIDILDAFETTKNKTVRSLSGSLDLDVIALFSGSLASTSAIDSLTIVDGTGSSFVQYSRFSLYGLRSS